MADLAEDHFLARLSEDWTNAKSHYHNSVDRAVMQVASSEPTVPLSDQDQYLDVDNVYNISWSTFGGMWEWPNTGTSY